MRVAPEFKIFTNVLSAVVDPKRFDPKSFVEFAGDVCAVPPSSFALARSVEYFRIPRNVLRSEEHTSELQSQSNLVCRLLLETKRSTYLDVPSARPRLKRAQK